jgi:hypothetical protein
MPTIFRHPVARLIAVVAALGLGLWGIVAWHAWHGEHVTECGVDAHGPYAKVGYNSFGDGLVKPADPLRVDFYYDGAWYSVRGGSVKISVLGSTTTVVHGAWPPRVVNLGADGGPKGKIVVQGFEAGGHWVNTGKGLQKTYPNLRPKFKALVEPNDKSLFGCRITPPNDS